MRQGLCGVRRGWGNETEELTEGIREPKHGVAWEEKGALAGAMTTDGAGDVKVALADSACVCFCTFAVSFTVCAGPGTACGAFSNTAARLGGGVGCDCVTDGGTEDLETGSDQGLRAFLSDATCFEGSSDGSTPLSICVTPDGEADAVVGDCAAAAAACGCLLLVHGRGGSGRGSEHGGRTEIGGRRTGVCKRVVCVGVGESGGSGGAVGGEDGASEEADV